MVALSEREMIEQGTLTFKLSSIESVPIHTLTDILESIVEYFEYV